MSKYTPLRFQFIVMIIALLISEQGHSESKINNNCRTKLSLEEFRAIGLSNSPLLAKVDQKYAEQLAVAFDLKVMANPDLELEQTYTNMELAGANDAQQTVSLGQKVRLSDFGKRDQVAKLIKKAAKIGKEAEIFELSQRMRFLYYRLWALQQTAEVLQQGESRAQNKLALIRDAVAKGLLSTGEEKLFEGEKYRLEASRLGVNTSIALTQHEIQKSFGISCVIATLPESKIVIPSVDELLDYSSSSKVSEKSRLEILDELALEQNRLAELDSYPEFTPRLVYQHTNDGGDFFGFGITIPLPAWNRNQSEKLKTEAEMKQIHARKKIFEPENLTSQLQYLQLANLNSQKQLKLFSANVIPSFQTALKIQEELFTKGQGDVLQVWQSLRLLSEVQEQSLKLWSSHIAARIKLSLLIGEEI